MRIPRPLLALLSCATLVIGDHALAATAAAQDNQNRPAAVVRDGLTEATAAASCWEIKQNNAQAPDGAYWLLTPTMEAPQQFFCDQTMDGGGWVMVGRGREGWDRYPVGAGNPADLLTRQRTPAAFGTVQLPNATIDGLLGGGHVRDLEEGMRVVRAADAGGTHYQHLDILPTKMQNWVWALATEDTARYRINNSGWRTAGSMENYFGWDYAWNMIDLTSSSSRGYRMGFGYGSSARGGDTSSTNFLWSSNGSAPLPYAEVYVRPKLRSTEGFDTIGDEGTAAVTGRALVSSFASRTTWGVTGNLNGRTAEGNSPAQAFAEIGDVVYVGGNFTTAEQRSTGTKVRRTAIAAFNKTTGDLIHSFNAEFDNQVKALLAMPNGKLLAGGDFKTVNGERRSGTVLLDPATGAIDPSWTLDITSRLSSGIVRVNSFALSGQYVYIGGNFTHFSSATAKNVYARAAGRVSLDGTPDRSWNPEFNGTVMDLDVSEAGDRFYAAGYFTRSATNTATKAAALSTAPGAAPAVPHWVFEGSAGERSNYQQTVDDSGQLVFIGGSEHSLYGYDPATMQRRSGSITRLIGGDLQAIATNGDITYAGCHCANSTYENAYTWPRMNSDWTRADNIQWVGAWDAATGQQLGEFSPYRLNSNNAGAWGLFLASDGALWVGGDFTGSRTSLTASQWNGGWVRYPAKDVTAPGTPRSVWAAGGTDTTVDLRWDGAQDAVRYEILRDDRVVATAQGTSASVPRGGANRFFVRAVDDAGNRSASTPVYMPSEAGVQDAASPVLIDEGSQWQYSYNQGTPAAGWNDNGFDRTGWATGTAPVGYGAAVATNVNPPAPGQRPVTTWFARSFTVADPAAFSTATLEYAADDGAVVYLNGQEIHRTRMPEGRINADTRANAAIRPQAAWAERSVVEVPSHLLRAGENTLAVETHLNYRSSPSMSFDGRLRITNDAPAPAQPAQPVNTTLIESGATWQYHYAADAPTELWASDEDVTAWQSGATPIGWGDAGVATTITVPAAERARAAYFVHDLDIDTAGLSDNAVVVLTVRADDGAVVYLNGQEVGRKRMPEGVIDHYTYANQAVRTSSAIGDPLEITIPVAQLRQGTNRIAVSSHLNYRNTPSMTFDLKAVVTNP